MKFQNIFTLIKNYFTKPIEAQPAKKIRKPRQKKL